MSCELLITFLDGHCSLLCSVVIVITELLKQLYFKLHPSHFVFSSCKLFSSLSGSNTKVFLFIN